MSNLSFGSFVWPNDPEHYEEKCSREPMYEKNGAGEAVFAGMGPVKRTVSGSGAFFGANAYVSFKSLLAQMGQAEPADLAHPVWGTRRAFLTELKSAMEPRADFVAYSFTFLDADANGAAEE